MEDDEGLKRKAKLKLTRFFSEMSQKTKRCTCTCRSGLKWALELMINHLYSIINSISGKSTLFPSQRLHSLNIPKIFLVSSSLSIVNEIVLRRSIQSAITRSERAKSMVVWTDIPLSAPPPPPPTHHNCNTGQPDSAPSF